MPNNGEMGMPALEEILASNDFKAALLFSSHRGLDDFLDLLSFCGSARLLSVRGLQTLCEFLSQSGLTTEQVRSLCSALLCTTSLPKIAAGSHCACRRCVAPGTAN